jgi:hypothetical protein
MVLYGRSYIGESAATTLNSQWTTRAAAKIASLPIGGSWSFGLRTDCRFLLPPLILINLPH